MKNNKGYYNWIHSMKQASLDAHQKGQEMKNLQEGRKRIYNLSQSDLTRNQAAMRGTSGTSLPGQDAAELEGLDRSGIEKTLLRTGSTPSNLSRGPQTSPGAMIPRRVYSLDDFQELHKKMTAEGDNPGQTPEQMYDTYLKSYRRNQELGMRPTNLTPSQLDLNQDGTVDGEDSLAKNLSWSSTTSGSVSDIFRRNIQDIAPDSPLPTYSLAAQARAEHARESFKEKHRQQRIAARQAASEQGHIAQEEAREEGIEGIVDRMMRGKR